MILILSEKATREDAQKLHEKLSWMGMTSHISEKDGIFRLAIVKGLDAKVDIEQFQRLPMVVQVTEFEEAYKLASKAFRREPTIIDIRGVKIGGTEIQMMAGPCSIESEGQIDEIAAFLKEQKVKILRGGAFKPRTSPYSFQGLGETGLKYMRKAADKYGLITISEVMDADHADLVADYVDILQVGARNMQNFSLLKRIGDIDRAIFIKRGMSATYKDLLMSAEYILSRGNPNVMLCERGIRTYETFSRNTLDVAAVPILHELTHLPVILDPSHGTGIRKMVAPMARAGIAASCDGLMVEMHPEPEKALSDKEQTIDFATFAELMTSLRQIAPAVNRTI